jgi:hypothetical protein
MGATPMRLRKVTLLIVKGLNKWDICDFPRR